MLPPQVASPLASAYGSLQAAERKLDWNVGRKKVELKEAIDHGQTVKRTLRVKLWNTVSGQKWQQPARPDAEEEKEEEEQKEGGIPGLGMANGEAKVKDEAVEGLDFGTGEGVPRWTFHIEGHLLKVRPACVPRKRELRSRCSRRWPSQIMLPR